MDKRINKYNLIQIGLWLVTIMISFIIIIIDKSEKQYRLLTYVFYFCYLIVPVISTAIQLKYYRIENENNYYMIIFIGIIILLSIMSINFINSVRDEGKIIAIISLIVLMAYNVFAIFYYRYKQNFKTYKNLTIIAILSLYLFIGLGIYITWYYSIIW